MHKQVFKRPQTRETSKILKEIEASVQWDKIDRLVEKLLGSDKEIERVNITFEWKLERNERR